MEIKTAVNLIRNGILSDTGPQTWYDLGAGSGLFTMALSALLPSGSQVTAVDLNASPLKNARQSYNGTAVMAVQGDFTTMDFGAGANDGILMANSLHFVRDKQSLLTRLLQSLKPHGRLVVVEYNTLTENPWVPYPISLEALNELLARLGRAEATLLGTTPSLYHKGGIYCACVTL